MTARAPSATAFTTSPPRRTPPSSSTSTWSPTAVGDRRQRPDRGRGAVEVVAAVVGHRDRADAGVHRPLRVVHPDHALEQERAAPLLAQPGQVVPARRRGLHPLAVRVEERRRVLAGQGHVRHAEVRRPAGPRVPGQPAGPDDRLRGVPHHGPQVDPVRDRRAAPVPRMREGPVRGDDQPDGAGGPGPLRPGPGSGPGRRTSRPGRTSSGWPRPPPRPACWRRSSGPSRCRGPPRPGRPRPRRPGAPPARRSGR